VARDYVGCQLKLIRVHWLLIFVPNTGRLGIAGNRSAREKPAESSVNGQRLMVRPKRSIKEQDYKKSFNRQAPGRGEYE